MIKIKDDLIIKTCMESHSMIEASEKLGVSIRWLKNKSKQLDCWNPNVDKGDRQNRSVTSG